jgi:hypothetical protein
MSLKKRLSYLRKATAKGYYSFIQDRLKHLQMIFAVGLYVAMVERKINFWFIHEMPKIKRQIELFPVINDGNVYNGQRFQGSKSFFFSVSDFFADFMEIFDKIRNAVEPWSWMDSDTDLIVYQM